MLLFWHLSSMQFGKGSWHCAGPSSFSCPHPLKMGLHGWTGVPGASHADGLLFPGPARDPEGSAAVRAGREHAQCCPGDGVCGRAGCHGWQEPARPHVAGDAQPRHLQGEPGGASRSQFRLLPLLSFHPVALLHPFPLRHSSLSSALILFQAKTSSLLSALFGLS